MVELTAERFTVEQAAAIERRVGDLALHAGAGAGKTTVLVERFARSVLDDGIDVRRLLCITFTEKAAGELRRRIRARLVELGALEAARQLDGAWISTIHGFCARILRAHALAAGVDPAFEVLDRNSSLELAEGAFEVALEELADGSAAARTLIAAHSPAALRAAILGCWGELRARGQARPSLPALEQPPDWRAALVRLGEARAALAAQLGEIAAPGARVRQALARLERCAELLREAVSGEPSAGADCGAEPDALALTELDAIALPAGNGAALATADAERYRAALSHVRRAREHQLAARAHALLGELLSRFGARYAERKRQAGGVDFEDLELLCAQLLERPELRAHYRERFQRVMVDEMQDTNAVQLALIERIASGRLFTVGDAQQAIYGFRHADVELFERRGAQLAARGAQASLQINFRARPELLERINEAFATLIDGYRPLLAGRQEASRGANDGGRGALDLAGQRDGTGPVELLIADKGADWECEGPAAPWRVAEADALAARLAALCSAGQAAGEMVVLLRAATDMRLYEQALERAGVPTYTIGGRGYWSHPQVIDLLCYLRALANPRDEEALLGLLVSPLVGASYDALVLAVAAARERQLDPWGLLRDPGDALDALDDRQRLRLQSFAAWFESERGLAWRLGPATLIERAIEASGYDLAVLAMRGGERRWANVRKLLRLALTHESQAGPDLAGFLALVRRRAAGLGGGEDREGEAPVEGDALDAVRLMTIHRAKGLEFEVVCVADLGRAPARFSELMAVGRDGRFGVRVAEPGTDRALPALHYDVLAEERRRREQAEERRLHYVAVTRARERLILSGALRLDRPTAGAAPMSWLAPAFLPELHRLVEEQQGVGANGVAFRFLRPAAQPAAAAPAAAAAAAAAAAPAAAAPAAPGASPPVAPCLAAQPVHHLAESGPAALACAPGPLAAAHSGALTLSYSALAEHMRCGLRFYVERVLGLPPARRDRLCAASGQAHDHQGGLDASQRGSLIHELLQRWDLRRPTPPSVEMALALAPHCQPWEANELVGLLARFAATPLRARLARAPERWAEQQFAFLLGRTLVRGAFDVLARERGGGMLVVDYKSDRLHGRSPEQAFAAAYGPQRLIYALAALRAGAPGVEVAHVFLEAPEEPVSASFSCADIKRLEHDLTTLAQPLLAGRHPVCEQPHLALCRDCPAAGGLCPHPLKLIRRPAPDRLL